MTQTQMKLLGVAAGAVVLITAGFAVAWEWQANAYGKTIAEKEASHQADVALIANAGADEARRALGKQQDAELRLAALDKHSTEEKRKLNDENVALRRAVADGSRRLRIAGGCSSGSENLSGTAGAAGVVDAGSVELSAETGQDILDIRAGIISDQAALKGLQKYVEEVCR